MDCSPVNTSTTWEAQVGSLEIPKWSSGKESTCQCRRHKRRGFDPWVGKIPWMVWQPTPVFLPAESHEQRSLVDYSTQGCKESNMTEALSTHTHIITKATRQGLKSQSRSSVNSKLTFPGYRVMHSAKEREVPRKTGRLIYEQQG